MKIFNHRNRVFILDQENKFLVMVRKFKDGTRAILLPGGGVDEGENSEQALVREVKEELNFTVNTHGLRKLFTHKQQRIANSLDIQYNSKATVVEDKLDFYYFKVDHFFEPEIKEPEKFDAVLWIKGSEIESVASKYNAEIGEGVVNAISLLLKQTQSSPAFSKW